jgi:type II secretory ATPase GspE/PulE/Tfp pilus assembly ATPase PilB-like protein
METLRQDGLRKVITGLTTLTEVVRVTQQEELPED